jgi:cation transport ATPase
LAQDKDEEKLKKNKIKNEQSRHNQHWAQDKNEEKLKKNKMKNEQSRHNQHWAQDKNEEKQKKNKIKNEQSRDLFFFVLFLCSMLIVSRLFILDFVFL